MTGRARPRPVTFLSDYGTRDEFVGVCHAVIARIAPDVRVLDVAHGLRGLRACGAALAQSVPYAPPDAVHLAVVDPGVGTTRRPVVLVAGTAALVGPDNGLLLDAAHALGGVDAAYELRESRYRLEPVSATFHGRDVFAPAAAHLALGVDPSSFGPPVDPSSLVALPPALVRAGPGTLESDVLRTDRFGNLQLAAVADDLAKAGVAGRVAVRAGGVERDALVVTTFADVPPGALAVLVDSSGHVAVAANLASADELLGRPARVLVLQRDRASGRTAS